MLNHPHFKLMLDSSYIAGGAILAQVTVVNGSPVGLWGELASSLWLGWVFYIAALLFGAAISVHQSTAVDDFIKYPKLKPLYSFGFGLFVTLFGIPIKYPELTIWHLILPAAILSAIGSQVIYYLIAFASSAELWAMLKSRLFALITGRIK